MHISIEQLKKITVRTISGKVDATSSDDLCAYLMTQIQLKHTNLIIDCKDLEFLSSSGMRTFLIILKELEKVHGALYFCNFKQHISEILSLAGINKYFLSFSSLEDAKNSLSSSLKIKK